MGLPGQVFVMNLPCVHETWLRKTSFHVGLKKAATKIQHTMLTIPLLFV